jgi:hypothetical protein
LTAGSGDEQHRAVRDDRPAMHRNGCRVYEIPGPDPSQMAGAVRCHRTAVATVNVDGGSTPVCRHHESRKWRLFRRDGWLYAFALEASSTP